MQLSVRQAASYLGVPESTVRRWIRQRGLPAHRLDERLHLNAIEVWEWATENGITVSRSLLDQARRQPDDVPALSLLLREGGVHYDVRGADKPSVLREVVARLPLPDGTDREFLVNVLEAREAMGSTGIGDGIAIPHVRSPIVLHVESPFVTLCLLETPVEFDAVDRQPVHALFTVISPSIPVHLRILAQLGLALRDDGLRQVLRRRGPAADILAAVERVEGRPTGSFRVQP